jgi:periplasmic protein TonB
MAASGHFDYEEQKRSFGARYGFVIGILVVAVIAVVLVSQAFSGKGEAPRKQVEMVMIKPIAPPPPPPPPPPPQTVPKQQMEDQTQVNEQDMKQAEQPPEDPSPSLGTGLNGNGPADGFGLGGKDKGFYAGSGGGGGGGSRFGGYFTAVQRAVTDALSRNAATRNANFNVRVRIWSDVTGRITRVKLADTTGDTALDQAIRTDALIGCQLPDIPSGMRMPLELRLNVRRPN